MFNPQNVSRHEMQRLMYFINNAIQRADKELAAITQRQEVSYKDLGTLSNKVAACTHLRYALRSNNKRFLPEQTQALNPVWVTLNQKVQSIFNQLGPEYIASFKEYLAKLCLDWINILRSEQNTAKIYNSYLRIVRDSNIPLYKKLSSINQMDRTLLKSLNSSFVFQLSLIYVVSKTKEIAPQKSKELFKHCQCIKHECKKIEAERQRVDSIIAQEIILQLPKPETFDLDRNQSLEKNPFLTLNLSLGN